MNIKARVTLATYRIGGKPFVQWNHSDGPLLVCANGAPHWLTWLERIKLALRMTSIEELNRKHGGAV